MSERALRNGKTCLMRTLIPPELYPHFLTHVQRPGHLVTCSLVNSTFNADGSVTSTDTLTLANGTTITAKGTSDGDSETYFESPYGNTTAEQLLDATLENENSCTYQAGSRTMFAPAPANWASDRMNTTQV